ILWSEQKTTFAGTILAHGGASGGNGGFVETSRHQLAFTRTVDTRAPKGTARALLLDPFNVTISAAPSNSGSFDQNGVWHPNDNGSNINVGQLVNLLGASNVVVTTANANGSELGNITVSAPVNWTSATTLTLNAEHNISINASVSASSGGLVLNAANAITATSAVQVASFTLQKGPWSQVSGELPIFSAQDFRITGGTFIRATGGNGGTETPYRITDVYGLQGIGSAGMTSNHFVLVKDIDASITAKWNGGAGFVPIGTAGSGEFSGSLNGQSLNGPNFIISHLTIPPDNSTNQNLAFFGAIASRGVVSNLNLTNVSVSANPGLGSGNFSQFVGTLAGSNAGTISNVSASGTVNGAAVVGVVAGGLVGQNGTFNN